MLLVFCVFHNPSNSDRGYRIFNMRMWSFLCMCTHTRVGHTDSESAQHSDSENSQFFFNSALDGVWTSGQQILSPTLYTSWATPSPNQSQFCKMFIYIYNIYLYIYALHGTCQQTPIALPAFQINSNGIPMFQLSTQSSKQTPRLAS